MCAARRARKRADALARDGATPGVMEGRFLCQKIKQHVRKTMPVKLESPAEAELQAVLGSAGKVWIAIIDAIEEKFSPLEKQWRPAKTEFGRICLLQHKKRTLLYMTPDKEKIWVAVVLGQRAAAIAATSELPSEIKKLIAEAHPYAEGRGIRFPVNSSKDVAVVTELVVIKTTPK
jgi:hypothetical protein